MFPPDARERGLPVQLTSFVGRAREIAEAADLLSSARLLTLTGAGGSGKTRLAIEIGRRSEAIAPGGVVWVELGSLVDVELIPHEIAAALGVREQEPGALLRVVLEVLDRRRPLLVLDNCEHLVDGCAELVDALLRGAPGLRILATSREALGVSGERAWLVPPLSLPEPSDPGAAATASEAVQLFLDRARDVRPGFTLTAQNEPAVVEICRRLDGIPLAIELAASRVRVLSPEQIAERLDRSFDLLTTSRRTALPRHRTLRAALDWSYRLLLEEEKVLLRRLAVFSGGFTLEAVEEVCVGDPVPGEAALDLLTSLVDRSLVVARERDDQVRYELLETVRQYASEQQEGQERNAKRATELRRRHAVHHLRLARSSHRAMEGYQRIDRWLPRLKAEQDNLRGALSWTLERDPSLALGLVGSLPYFWIPQPVHWREGLRWTEAALERAPVGSEAGDLCAAAWAAALLAVLLQDWTRARQRVEETITHADEAGDRRARVLALGLLAMIMAVQGEVDAGLPHGEEATRLARELGEPWLVVVSLITGVASPQRMTGALEAAEPAMREALTVSLREDYAWGVWEAGMHLALLALKRGELEEAHRLAATAAEASGQMGADWHATRVLVVLAWTLVAAQDADRAARVVGAVEAWLESTGSRLLPDEEALRAELTRELASSLGEEGFQRGREGGRTLTLSEALALATREEGAPGDPRGGPGGERVGVAPGPAAAPSRKAAAPGAAAVEWPAGSDLQVSALGPVRVEVGGEPLGSERWSHGKPRELLLYLLANPPGRTRAQIGLAFWPDASAAQVKNSFHVLLHTLRKALGDRDLVVLDGDRYRISPDADVWFDARVFEAELGRLLRGGAGDGTGERLERVLDLYQGDFLEGGGAGDWHLEIHDHLRRLYVDGLSRLADLKEEEGDLHGAVDALERLVLKEPLREEAYRRLMMCLARADRRDRALQHYSRLRTLLSHELEAEPEAGTASLAARIRDGAAP